MKNQLRQKGLTAIALVWTAAIFSVAVGAQTRVNLPKNKYKLQDDVKIGREAAVQVEQQFPILNDSQAQRYVEQVGERLVASIPPQFRQSGFDYTFKVVNARDINAFALPGGPMYVNRGMIQAARNEGEMAGVMAHEISHVALRHATAQATKQGSVKNQLGTIGLILGGAILGGQSGAQLGALGAQVWTTRYSRDYETQADVLGAQILADAGYDPRDLANMFQTIARQSGGGRAPEWMSSHPDPGNRFQNINREAALLRVSSNPIKVTRDFSRVQERLESLPRAQSMAEIQRDYKSGRGTAQSPTAGGRYSDSVQYPSSRTRVYDSTGLRLSVPSNWREFSSQENIIFAPEGAYGNEGITHGALIGLHRAGGSSFANASQDYMTRMLEANTYLRQRTSFIRTTVAGRDGYTTTLSGRSPITSQNELVTIFTAPLRNGDLLYIAAVVPENESSDYSGTFRTLINSIRVNDQ